MRTNVEHLSPLQALAGQWVLLVMACLGYARTLSSLKEAGARGTRAQVETLELAVRTAIVSLNREIILLRQKPGARTPEDEVALNHMSAVWMTLWYLAAFLAYLKIGLKLSAAPEAWRQTIRQIAGAFALPAQLHLPDIWRARRFFDSG